MVGKKVAAQPNFDDTVSYISTVKAALHGEPAKYKYFLKLLGDICARRIDKASFVARVELLFKDYPNLLSGLNAYLPAQFQIFIPPEPEQPTDPAQVNNMVGTKVAAQPTSDDAVSYIYTVKKALHGDSAKFKDFINLGCDLHTRRIDQASFVARVEQLFKDHPNLFSGLNAFLPAELQILVPPEPEQPTELSDNIKRKRDDAEDLFNKIKERFQRCDTHVPNSFVKIMEDFKQRKKSEKEIREEVLNLLCDHEDLRGEFLRFLQQTQHQNL